MKKLTQFKRYMDLNLHRILDKSAEKIKSQDFEGLSRQRVRQFGFYED